MKLKRILLSFLFLALLSIGVNAQTASGSFMLGLPQGEFKENVDRLGYGLQLHGTIWAPSRARPFTVGINFGYLVYGEESFRRPFSITNPDVTVNVDRRYSMMNFHLLFQVAPFQGTVRPYAEGLFGGSYIFTTTDIESERDFNNVASSTNFDDWAWNYGAGFGLLIQVGKDMGDVSNLFLDLRGRYLFGNRAEYLKEGDVIVDSQNGTVTYNVTESKTDLISISIGVTAYFN